MALESDHLIDIRNLPMIKPKDKEAITGNSNDKENLSDSAGRSHVSPPPSDSPVSSQLRTLAEFREKDGRANRKRRLQNLWKSLPDVLHEPHNRSQVHVDPGPLTPERAENLQKTYDRELLDLCATHPSAGQAPYIGWEKFKEFADKKEAGKSHFNLFFHVQMFIIDGFNRTLAHLP